MDVVIFQLRSRFTDQMLSVVRQMQLFSHSNLINMSTIEQSSVSVLCNAYQLDSQKIIQELNEFYPVYRSIHHMISVEDLIAKNKVSSHLRCTWRNNKGENLEDDEQNLCDESHEDRDDDVDS